MFYRHLVESESPLLPVLHTLNEQYDELAIEFCPANSSLKQFYIPDKNLSQESKTFNAKEIGSICLLLLKSGMRIYNIPQSIVRSFNESKVPLKELNPTDVIAYLKAKANDIIGFSKPVSETIFKDVETVGSVLKYCLTLKDIKITDLEGLPLLVTEDGLLRIISSSTEIYFKELSTLFPNKKLMCLHPHLRQFLANFIHPSLGWPRRLTLQRLNDFCYEELNSELRSTREIQIQSVNGSYFPTKKWLIHLWNFLQNEHKRKCAEHRRKEEERKSKLIASNGKTWCFNYYHEQREESFKDFLRTISEWCFLPVKRKVNNNLKEPFKKSLMKIDSISSIVCLSSNMSNVGNELGLPCLDEAAIDSVSDFIPEGDNAKYIKTEFATDDNPESFLQALWNEFKNANSRFQRITPEVAKQILEYFNNSCSSNRLQSKSLLKSLPLFEDISGQHRALNKVNDVYRAPPEMPKSGIHSLEDVIFLKENNYLNRLYDFLGINKSNITNAYVKYVFPFFTRLNKEERLKHLEFLRTTINSVPEEGPVENLLASLRKLAFIECEDGNLLRANQLYDPKVTVFKLMLPKEKFPPMPYYDIYEWLLFLRKCGLNASVTSEMFLKFAREVSEMSISKETEEDIRSKSKTLVDYLFASEDLKEDTFFLPQLSTIKFLLQDSLPEVLQHIFSTDRERMICFKDAVHDKYSKYLKLAWTEENILPNYVSMNFSYHFQLGTSLKQSLQIKDKIDYISVVKNIINIVTQSNLLTRKTFGVQEFTDSRRLFEFEDVVLKSYEFLSNNFDIETEAISLLKEHTVILVNDGKMVTPKKTTLEEKSEIKPYLFAVPVKHGKYFDFLEALGTTKQATYEQFANVLCDINASTNGTALSPNEASVVFKAANGLSVSIQNELSPSLDINLYLPGKMSPADETINLFNSKELVYFDDRHFGKRLDKLQRPRIASGEDLFKDKDLKKLIDKLPECNKPIYISKIVKENLLPADTVSNGDFAEQLQSKIQSTEFVNSIMRLLKHQLHEGPEMDVKLPENLDVIISNTRVSTLSEVNTALFDCMSDSNSSNNIIQDSKEHKDIFVIDKDAILYFYVAQNQRGSLDGKNISTVTRELSVFFRGFLTDAGLTPLIGGLLSCQPEEMQLFLDEANIRRSDEHYISHSPVYKIGELVPIVLHCLLVNDIVQFEIGEFVAYEAEDPLEKDIDGEAVYIYAKIVEIFEEDGDSNSLKCYYKIEYLPGEFKRVHCSEIYGFERHDEYVACLVPSFGASDSGNQDHGQELGEVMEELTRIIESAFKENKDHFRKIIKRLYLKWHPDKNPGREVFCKQVFQHIQKEAERMEKLPESFFTQFFYRGTRFGCERRKFHSNRSDYSWFSEGSRGYWRREHSETKNPQPGEARRWYRQAKYDFGAATSDLGEGCYEWVCFKCHQAAEKSLKAAVYTVDDVRTNDHNLIVIAMNINNSYVKQLASELKDLLGNSVKLRYPNAWCYPDIPHTKYSRETALQALKITEKLMDEIEKIVNDVNW